MVAQIDKAMFRKRFWKIPGRLMAYIFIEGRALTTKGQWINPVVFAGYKLAQMIKPPVKSKAPIFIIGTGRSGTTVLGKLFAMHSETVFLNEPKAIWHYAHGAEDIIGSYTTGPSTIRLEKAKDPQKLANKISNIYGWSLFWGGARRIVDKYPELVFRTDFVNDVFPDAKFIAILRDGVDTCSSVTNWSKRKGVVESGETHDWWGREDRKWNMIVDQIVPEHDDLAPLADQLRQTKDHRDRAAVEWIVSMREAQAAQTQQPDSVLCITYEDLCARPAEVLLEMTDSCDLAKDPVFEEYALSILSVADTYGSLELMEALVEPFKKTLADTGYSESISRVTVR